jgi:DnaJ-class molecular chaperone
MGMITSRVETICCMCNMAPGRGKWSLCPTCEDQVAERIEKKLGTTWQPTCKGCGEQEVIAGRYCEKCRSRFTPPESAEPE